MWLSLMIIFLVVMILQTGTQYFQTRSVYSVIYAYKKEYSAGYYLATGRSKNRKILGSGTMIVTVVDEDDRIVEFQEMDGYTVFARLKPKDEYIGLTLDEVLAGAKSKGLKKAMENAIDLLTKEKQRVADKERLLSARPDLSDDDEDDDLMTDEDEPGIEEDELLLIADARPEEQG